MDCHRAWSGSAATNVQVFGTIIGKPFVCQDNPGCCFSAPDSGRGNSDPGPPLGHAFGARRRGIRLRGQLLLQDVSPYKAAYNVTLKLPGTCVAYALIMAVFGQTAAALHAGVILVNLATAVLVFVMARRICGEAAGVVAAGTYALLSIVPETLGLAAHATHFVVLPALAGVVLLQNLDARTSSARIFSAGLLIGLAVLMKQTGAAFGLFAASWILWREFSSGQKQWSRLAARLAGLALGGLLPFFLTGFHNRPRRRLSSILALDVPVCRPARYDFHRGTWNPMDVLQPRLAVHGGPRIMECSGFGFDSAFG